VTRPVPRLLSLATAVPPYALGQPEVAIRARHLFTSSGVDVERLMPVFANSGIERRYSSVPLDWYEHAHGWPERNALYLEHAVTLLAQAAGDALALAGLKPEAIDSIVVVSTTGVATPGLDARVMEKLPFRRDVKRLPIFGLGCAGGVLGLSRAADLARVAPESRVLLLVVELCALSFRKDDTSKSNVVATALFGDGAAAAVLSCRGDGPRLGAAGEYTWPQSLDIMGWDVAEDGLRAVFSRDIPALVRRHMRDVVGDFLTRHELEFDDIDHFVCHPGGAKVLTALEEAFRLDSGALTIARGVLRDFGNMSAATVLFVLEQSLRAGASGTLLMTTLGPGFTAGFQIVEAA
jgi:alkylresorcinol/alkylpyrone synthase